MRVDKSKWKQNIMSDCFKTIKVKDAIQKKDYQQYGKYPIISQEKDFISGYCDSVENLNSIGEVVIFGDHTRVLKFVDFDFCVGADGVKVIRPNPDISTKYLFYFLKWVDIPSNGYSRHFKFLKELNISYPLLTDQQAIASELDAIQTMIDGYKAQLVDLDELIKSIFNNTFGDIYSNPNNFDIKLMQDVCSKITDGTHNPPKFVDSGIPFIFVSNIVNYEISFLAKKRIDDASYNELWKSTPVEVGDIVYSSVGSYGNPAIVRTDKKFMFQRHIALLKPKHDVIDSEYLKWFLISPSGKEQADNKAIGAAQKTLNLKAIKTFKVLVPPKEIQQYFIARVGILEKQRTLLQEQLKDAETLMAERMQYYFS